MYIMGGPKINFAIYVLHRERTGLSTMAYCSQLYSKGTHGWREILHLRAGGGASRVSVHRQRAWKASIFQLIYNFHQINSIAHKR